MLCLCERCAAGYEARVKREASQLDLIQWIAARTRYFERRRARQRLNRALERADRFHESEGKKRSGAIENGLTCGKVDHHGELELIMTVDGQTGSAFVSREMWEAFGEQFRDAEPAEPLVAEAEKILAIGGAGTRAEMMFKGRRIVRGLLKRIRELEERGRLPSELQRMRDRGDA